MFRLTFLTFTLLPQMVLAGCLSLLDPPDDSGCSRSSSELMWLNPSHLLQRAKLARPRYDRPLSDPAFAQGLALKDSVQFELKAPGPHLVEVFLAVEGNGSEVVLEAGRNELDTARPAGVRPEGELHSLALLGIVTGRFTIRAKARYVLSAIRWTSREEFDNRVAPVWLDRARQMAADPFFEDLRAARLDRLAQLYDRLALSSRPEIRREAIIGQARVTYWTAAKTHRPEDIDRATFALRDAFKLAPEDKIVREMISAACSEKNVRGARMPYGVFCLDVVPVYWTVPLAAGPEDAPPWAVTQRHLAARLETVTQWWVEQRQQAGGELGGGWKDDAELVRQWGWQAIALGSAAAATGVRRFDEGLAASEGGDGSVGGAAGEIHLLAQATAGKAFPVRQAPAPRETAGSYSEPLPSEVVWNMAYLAQDSEKALARDFAMYTSEVIYTDRVYYPVPADYWRSVVGGDAKGQDPIAGIAATFPPSGASFARAVVQASAESLKLRLYSFEGKPTQANVRVWRLTPGTYRWETTDMVGTRIAAGSAVIKQRGQQVTLPVAQGKEIDVTFSKVHP